jgi:hypothetical protein
MIAVRLASSSRPQVAISARVRWQPTHRPLAPSTAHTWTQGVTMGLGEPFMDLDLAPRAAAASM